MVNTRSPQISGWEGWLQITVLKPSNPGGGTESLETAGVRTEQGSVAQTQPDMGKGLISTPSSEGKGFKLAGGRIRIA